MMNSGREGGDVRKKTVWIVDDDREFLAELREALDMSGYRAEAFFDAAAMKRRLREASPDVVLLDLKMEPENGFELARELKHRPRAARVPVIAMTGHYTSLEHARLMGECGIALCLVKPLNLAAVLERIALVTDRGGEKKGVRTRPGAGRHAHGRAGSHIGNTGALTGG